MTNKKTSLTITLHAYSTESLLKSEKILCSKNKKQRLVLSPVFAFLACSILILYIPPNQSTHLAISGSQNVCILSASTFSAYISGVILLCIQMMAFLLQSVPVKVFKSTYSGTGAEMAFQCTGSPKGASTIWKYVRRGGSMCELGFFVNNGDTTYNPHLDICNKEIKVTGSWTYQAKDWVHSMEFLKEANDRGLPVKDLLTDKFPLEKINDAMHTNMAMTGLKIVIKP